MILHITSRAAWEAAQSIGHYQSDSLATEGFIHCSTVQQVLGPANTLYAGQQNLVLLGIDPALVQAPLVYEDCYESGQRFPHIYGSLNLNAVVKVVDFPPNPNGTFSLPDGMEAA